MGNFKGYDKDWATKELPLRIDLMVSEYRQARDKKAQIDILAEQCGTRPCRIAWILDRCGLTVDPKKLPRALRGEHSFDYVGHWESSTDAVICDRILERHRELAGEAVEKLKETVEKEPEMVEMWMGGADTETVPAEKKQKDAITKTTKDIVDSVVKAAKPTPELSSALEGVGGALREMTGLTDESETAEAEAELPEKGGGWKDPADLRREILTDAAVCVCSDRNLMCGEPEDNFDVIAAMWSAYLGMPVTASDVAAMMILFKVARIATAEKPSRDSYVDIAGYAACGGGMIK